MILTVQETVYNLCPDRKYSGLASESKRWIIYSNKYNLYNISMLTFVVLSDEIRVYWQGVVLAL